MVGGPQAGLRLGIALAAASSTVVGSVARSRGRTLSPARAVQQERTGPTTLSPRACPSSTRPQSPTHWSDRPLSYGAVAIHLGPCEQLLHPQKRATRAVGDGCEGLGK